jgi:hypothetical protein
LGNYTEVPPADAWQDLDKKLDTLTPHVPTAPVRWLTHVGMVSLIAVLSVSFVQKFYGKHKGAADVADAQQSNTTPTEVNNTTNTDNGANSIAEASNVNETDAAAIADNTTQDNVSAEEAYDDKDAAVGNSIGNSNGANNYHTNNNAVAANTSTGNTGNNEMEYGDDVSFSPDADKEYVNDGSHNYDKKVKENRGNGEAIVNNEVNSFASQSSNARAKAATTDNITEQEEITAYHAAKGDVSDKKHQVGNDNSTENQLIANSETINATSDAVKTINATADAVKAATTINPSATTKAATATKQKAPKPARNFARWEAGVKSGYERGFDNMGSTKFAIAPYLQYNVTGRIAIMTQPAVKFANAPTRVIGAPEQYYNVNNDGKVTAKESFTTVKVEGGSVQEYNNTRYNYTRSHDSIVKTNRTGGRYMEYELPLLIKYSLSKKSSVYGGVNIVYSQLQQVKEHTYTKAGIVRSVDTLITAIGEPIAPAIDDILTHNGTAISDYNGPLYPVSSKQNVRMGAMLGFTYQYSSRLMLDALVQKNPAPVQSYNGYNINAPLSSTSFRISVGYKITK